MRQIIGTILAISISGVVCALIGLFIGLAMSTPNWGNPLVGFYLGGVVGVILGIYLWVYVWPINRRKDGA